MTTFEVYKKEDIYEDYKLVEAVEIEDTPENREDLIDDNFHDSDGWEVEDEYEEFLDGETDEIYFYRTNIPNHSWDKDIEGYIIKC